MDRAERGAFITAVAFMGVFFALIVYAAKGLNINVPTCITDVKPFTQGQVIQHAPDRHEIHYLAKMW
jgi:cytochrome c oxidase subunit 2